MRRFIINAVAIATGIVISPFVALFCGLIVTISSFVAFWRGLLSDTKNFDPTPQPIKTVWERHQDRLDQKKQNRNSGE